MTQLQQLGDFLGRKIKMQDVNLAEFKLAVETQNTQNNLAITQQIETAKQEANAYTDTAKQDANNYTDGQVSNLFQTVNQNQQQVLSDIESEHSMMLTGVEEAKQESKVYTDTAIANLVDSAPETMNTLKELADAIEANETVLEAIQDVTNNHTHANATQTVAGFMSAEDKTALDNVGTYAQLVAAFNTVVGASSPLYETDENNPPAIP